MSYSPLAWINAEYRKLDRSPRALRKFGFTFAGGLLSLAILLALRGHGTGWICGAIALGLLVTASLAPNWLGVFHRVVLTFSLVLGAIVTPIILTIFFFAVVTPVGLLQRLFGKRSIDLGFGTKDESYWTERAKRDFSPDYEKQY